MKYISEESNFLFVKYYVYFVQPSQNYSVLEENKLPQQLLNTKLFFSIFFIVKDNIVNEKDCIVIATTFADITIVCKIINKILIYI